MNEDQLYDLLDAKETETKLGYGDGAGHDFTASQHTRILESRNEDVPTDGIPEATRNLKRETLRLKLAVDAASVLNSSREEYLKLAGTLPLPEVTNVANRLAIQQQAAIANPEKAAAAAVVESNAPVGTPPERLSAVAFQEYQLSTVASAVGDKKWIFSKNSYATDAASLFLNPVRTIWGQGRAGKELGLNRTGYYAFVKQWHTLPQEEQELAWDTVVSQIKTASGNNDLVFFGLIYPLIYPQQENMPYADAALDILDFGITVGAWRLAKALKSKLSYRGRALMHGNPKEAAKATTKGIKAGDIDAIADGHPIPDPIDPSGLSAPTQLHIVDELVATGRMQEGEELVTRGIPLTREEAAIAVEKREGVLVATGARVISKDIGPEAVEFTYEIQKPYSSVSVTNLAGRQAQIEKTIAELVNERKLLIAGSEPGANAEKVAELTDRINKLQKWEEQLLEGIAKGDTSVTLEATKPEIIRRTMYFTEDDVGKINFKDKLHIGFYTHFFGTPESRIGKLLDGFTSYATFMRQQQRRIFGYFDKEVRALRKQLKGNAGMEVDQLMLTGDRLQRVFSEDELYKEGVNVDGIGFMTFTPTQVDAYHRLRRAYDDLYILANRMQRDELLFSGYEMFFGKLLDEAGAPVKDVRLFGKTNRISFTPPENGFKSRVASVIDLRASSATKGVPVKLDSILDLQKGLDSKQMGFVELRTPLRNGDGSRYGYALVDIAPDGRVLGAHVPDQVLDYRVGYTPKLAQENIRWVVERPQKAYVDGTEVDDTIVVRGFETEAEADIFINKKLAEGKGANLKKQQITPDWRNNPRNKEKVEFIDNALFRGAFVGHRSENGKFLIGLEGREAARVSSFDALQRYADYVAAYTPMHLYKQGMIKRFIAAANEGNFLTIGGKWDAPLNGSGDEWARLKAIQDWMKASFAVPTSEEHLFAKITDKMLGFLEKAIYNVPQGKQRKGTNTLKALHHWIATSRSAEDPVSFIKGITFDLMLGSFNPAQFFVQSAGMFIPTTLHPIEAAAAMPEFLYIRSAMHAGDYNKAAQAAGKLGYNKRKMSTMLHAWHRSGIPDSILENADFGHYAGTHGAYYSPSMINSIRENSRFFYNAGELNNRLFSFVMAFNRKSKELGWDLTKKLTDDQIQEVTKEALRIGTNMTAGNKAKWQDGILGLPTQFWQQTHKYYENLFYGLSNLTPGVQRKLGLYKENQWTAAESVTALAMNALLFGAAGYGLDEWTNALDRWMVDPNGLGLDPEKDRGTIALLRGGFLEMMSFETLGFEVDITDRVGPASGSNIVFEKLIKPMGTAAMEGKMGEFIGTAFLGPTNTTLTRGLEAGKKFVTTLQADADQMTWDYNTVLASVADLTAVSTSITNLERALAWEAANDILNNRNIPLAIVENGTEIPISLVLLKAAGFDPLSKEKMEKLLRQKTMSDKEKSSMSRNIADEYRRFFLTKGEGTLVSPAQMEIIQRRIALRKKKVAEKFGQEVADEIMANVINILNEEEYSPGMDYQTYLFQSILEATPYSQTEIDLMNDKRIADELVKIRGNKNAE